MGLKNSLMLFKQIKPYFMSLILWGFFLTLKLNLKESFAGEEFPLLSLTIVFVSVRYGVRPALLIAALSVFAEYHFFLAPIRGTNEQLVIAASLAIYSLIVLTITYVIGRQKSYEKKLASLYEHQGQWVANVSHEVRTPLNGILGLVELLKKENLNPHQRSLLDHIEKSSFRLKSIVESILNFSKAGLERTLVENDHPFSINELCQHIVDIYKPRFFQKNIDFHYSGNANEVLVKSNQTNISQILTNLLENALKYTNEGRVDLIVRKKSENDETVNLEFLVRDTGVGLDKSEIDLIFEPYFRGKSKTNAEGVGLGLPIVKKLIQERGGQIKVRSEKKIGSEFQITIPFQKAKEFFREQQPMPSQKKPTALLENKQTALVAEDNPINQMVLKNQLEGLGIHTVLTEDGERALRTFQQQSFNFVIMDAHMPNQNGLEAARAIRAFEKNQGQKRTPIICITADVTYQKSQHPEIDLFLFKPVTADEIQTALDQVTHQNTKQIIEGIFLKDTPQKIAKILQSLHAQNFIEIEAIAHNLKSSFYALGDNDSAALCQVIYDSAKRTDLIKLHCSISDLEQKYNRMRETLEAQS